MPTWTRRVDEALLEDARERAGMREAVALEDVVEVGMGVDVEKREPREARSDGAQHGKGHGVVAAERDHPAARIVDRRDAGFDPRARLAVGVGGGRSRSPASARAPGAEMSTSASLHGLVASDQSCSRMSGGAPAGPRRNDELAS